MVTADSREAKLGSAFVAVSGAQVDGNDFIESALDQGCQVIVSEQRCPSVFEDSEQVAWIRVGNARLALAKMATNLAGHPTKSLKVAGVTGTNGKTTVTYLTHAILQKVRHRAGLLGTIKNYDGVQSIETKHTTPDAVSVQSLFSAMLDQGCREAVMEVSSIGVDQHRVTGAEFAVGAFTNLTQDHLDYHGSMEKYFQAKRQFFVNLSKQKSRKARMVINLDDPYGERLVREFKEDNQVYSFGYALGADFRITRSAESLKGIEFEFSFQGKFYLVRLPLIGRFNVYNAMTSLVTAYALGLKISEVIEALEDCPQIPGRLEKVGTSHDITAFVDYAHTPDALENVCSTLRGALESGRLITVFGCGGDRDATKRPLMAQAASRYSDVVIVTADNPRSEPLAQIFEDIQAGLNGAASFTEVLRDKAIEQAIFGARPGDIVLIAGKGHEDYQIIGEAVIPFSDREATRKHLDALKKSLAIEAAEKEKQMEEEFEAERRERRQFRKEESYQKED